MITSSAQQTQSEATPRRLPWREFLKPQVKEGPMQAEIARLSEILERNRYGVPSDTDLRYFIREARGRPIEKPTRLLRVRESSQPLMNRDDLFEQVLASIDRIRQVMHGTNPNTALVVSLSNKLFQGKILRKAMPQNATSTTRGLSIEWRQIDQAIFGLKVKARQMQRPRVLDHVHLVLAEVEKMLP